MFGLIKDNINYDDLIEKMLLIEAKMKRKDREIAELKAENKILKEHNNILKDFKNEIIKDQEYRLTAVTSLPKN